MDHHQLGEWQDAVMGIDASDAYLGWRKGGAPDIAAIERADQLPE
jgi:hypothetical protein